MPDARSVKPAPTLALCLWVARSLSACASNERADVANHDATTFVDQPPSIDTSVFDALSPSEGSASVGVDRVLVDEEVRVVADAMAAMDATDASTDVARDASCVVREYSWDPGMRTACIASDLYPDPAVDPRNFYSRTDGCATTTTFGVGENRWRVAVQSELDDGFADPQPNNRSFLFGTTGPLRLVAERTTSGQLAVQLVTDFVSFAHPGRGAGGLAGRDYWVWSAFFQSPPVTAAGAQLPLPQRAVQSHAVNVASFETTSDVRPSVAQANARVGLFASFQWAASASDAPFAHNVEVTFFRRGYAPPPPAPGAPALHPCVLKYTPRARQPDGGVIAGSEFTFLDGACLARLARFASDDLEVRVGADDSVRLDWAHVIEFCRGEGRCFEGAPEDDPARTRTNSLGLSMEVRDRVRLVVWHSNTSVTANNDPCR